MLTFADLFTGPATEEDPRRRAATLLDWQAQGGLGLTPRPRPETLAARPLGFGDLYSERPTPASEPSFMEKATGLLGPLVGQIQERPAYEPSASVDLSRALGAPRYMPPTVETPAAPIAAPATPGLIDRAPGLLSGLLPQPTEAERQMVQEELAASEVRYAAGRAREEAAQRAAAETPAGRSVRRGLAESSIGLAARGAAKLAGAEVPPIPEAQPDEGIVARAMGTLAGFTADLPLYVAGGKAASWLGSKLLAVPGVQKLLTETLPGMIGKAATVFGVGAEEASKRVVKLIEDAAIRRTIAGATTGTGAFGAADTVREVLREANTSIDAGELRFDPLRIATEGGKGAVLGGVVGGIGGALVARPVLDFLAQTGALGTIGPLMQGRQPTMQDLVDAGVSLGVLKAAYGIVGSRWPTETGVATGKEARAETGEAYTGVWATPRGKGILKKLESLQSTAMRGATPGEQSAAARGFLRILEAHGLGVEDLPPGWLKFNPQEAAKSAEPSTATPEASAAPPVTEPAAAATPQPPTPEAPKPAPAGRIRTPEELAASNQTAIAAKKPVAPAVYFGPQNDMEGRFRFDLWNLTADIPGHPKNSTVSSQTLLDAGYQLPEKTETPGAPPIALGSPTATPQPVSVERPTPTPVTPQPEAVPASAGPSKEIKVPALTEGQRVVYTPPDQATAFPATVVTGGVHADGTVTVKLDATGELVRYAAADTIRPLVERTEKAGAPGGVERRAQAAQPVTPAQTPAPPAAPAPGRSLWIGRGAHGSVKVVFPDRDHADLYSWSSRLKKRAAGEPGIEPDSKGLAARLGIPEKDLGKTANAYRDLITDSVKPLDKGAILNAPRYDAQVPAAMPAPVQTTAPAPATEKVKVAEEPTPTEYRASPGPSDVEIIGKNPKTGKWELQTTVATLHDARAWVQSRGVNPETIPELAKTAPAPKKPALNMKPAVDYIRGLKNLQKREYATEYLAYITGQGTEIPPKHPKLGYMAAQAVRMEIDRLVEAKAEPAPKPAKEEVAPEKPLTPKAAEPTVQVEETPHEAKPSPGEAPGPEAGRPGPEHPRPLAEAPAPGVSGAGAEGGGGGVLPPAAGALPRPGGAPEPAEPAGGGRRRNPPGTVLPPERGGEPTPELVAAQQTETPPPKPASHPPDKSGRDYVITDADAIGKGTEKQKFDGNVAAIKTLKTIEEAGRLATPEEQAALVKYVGWGALPNVFDRSLDPEGWNRQRREERRTDAARYDAVKALLTDEEREAASSSTINAHYTSPEVIQAIWTAMERLGIRSVGAKIRILEPAGGVGHFLGLQPPDLAARSQRTLIELDSLTGRIARQLYQGADVQIKGFQDTLLPDNWFHAAVSNVPFANVGVFDPAYKRDPVKTGSLHNYFFFKALDKVAPGGVVAFITSRFTMDSSKNQRVREKLSEQADILGAIRLPETAFKANAGTEVVTDILFLRKRAPGEPAGGESWFNLAQAKDSTGQPLMVEEDYQHRPAMVNEYFTKHPEMVLGHHSNTGTMYRKGTYTVTAPEKPLAEELAKAIGKLPEKVLKRITAKQTVEREIIPAPDEMLEGSFTMRRTSPGGKVHEAIFQKRGPGLERVDIPLPMVPRVKGLIEIRDVWRRLIGYQVDPNASENQIQAARKNLNAAYDRFVNKYGSLHEPVNQRTPFRTDPEYFNVLAIEEWDREKRQAGKSDIFTKRTMLPVKRIQSAETAKDALVVSLVEHGRVDFGRMGELTGKTEETLQAELAGLVYHNPEGEWEPADVYLSGNVRQKLAAAQAASRTEPKRYQANVEALEKVQPAEKTPGQIGVRLGSPWIPKETIQQFVAELVRVSPGNVTVRYVPQVATWTVESVAGSQGHEATSEWGTERLGAIDLINMALNLKDPLVKDTVRDEQGDRTVVNKQATLAAKEKLAKIGERFKVWVWEDVERAQALARIYNEEFNNYVPWKPDASFLPDVLPGQNPAVKLHLHQKNWIWRAIVGKNFLMAGEVGTGKTYAEAGAAIETRRIGLKKKPLLVVWNSTLDQFAAQVKKLYPAARLLVPGERDFEPANRREFFGRMASGDWDAIIIAQSQMKLIPLARETKENYFRDQLRELEDAILAAQAEEEQQYGRRRGRRGGGVKDLEKAKDRLKAKLKALIEQPKKDPGMTFEQMGVDLLIVDEAHAYKNLFFVTKLQRTKGLPTGSESDRAMDMFLKVRHVQKANNGSGVLFATGTPITNTVAEVFNLQRYLQPEVLREQGLEHFDAWVQNFADKETGLEYTATGKAALVTRLAKFSNLRELKAVFRQIMDHITSEEAGLQVPEAEMVSVEAPETPELKAFVASLNKRAESLKQQRGGEKGADNILVVNTDGKKAALDMRLVSDVATDRPDNKVSKAAENIYREWKNGKAERLTQLVFIDMSIPKSAKRKAAAGPRVSPTRPLPGFTFYDALKEKLVRMGIPKEEIAFIHDYKKGDPQKSLFAQVNAGQVRVLLGSREKLGVGVNIQERLAAVHDLDPPWRPDQVEQGHGRILRPGNRNTKVRIYNYITKRSFDATMWGFLERKWKMVESFMGTGDMDTMEDIGPVYLNPSQIRAIATDNPKVMEKFLVDQDVMKYQTLEAAHREKVQTAVFRAASLPAEIKAIQEQLSSAKADAVKLAKTEGEKFALSLEGGRRIEDREAAGKAIVDAAAAVWGKPGEKTVGTYRGFPVVVSGDSLGAARGHLVGSSDRFAFTVAQFSGEKDKQRKAGDPMALAYEPITEAGAIMSLEAAAKHMAGQVAVHERNLATLQGRLAGAQKDAAATFEHESKLADLLQRQAELEKELMGDPTKAAAESGLVDVGDAEIDTGEEVTGAEKDEEDIDEGEGTSDEEGPRGQLLGSGLGGMQYLFERRHRRPTGLESPNPRVEAVLKGSPQPGILGRLTANLKEWGERFQEDYVYGYVLKHFPKHLNDFRLAKDFPGDARRMTAEDLVPILRGLQPEPEYDTFRRLVVLRDLESTSVDGKTIPAPGPGQAPLKLDEVQAEIARLEALASPAVLDALSRHDALMQEHGAELALRGEIKPEAVRGHYFPHHVLDYTDRLQLPGLPRHLQKSYRSYVKAREGSARMIDVDYFRVMWQHLVKYHLHNFIDDFALAKLEEIDETEKVRDAIRSNLTAQGNPEADEIADGWTPEPGERQLVGDQVYEGVQFQRGRTFYWTGTVPEGFAERTLAESTDTGGRLGDVPLEPTRPMGPQKTVEESIRGGFAMGRPYKVYMAPVELAHALRQFRDPNVPSAAGEAVRSALRWWKRTTLGFAGLPYQYWNFFGDLDALGQEKTSMEVPYAMNVAGILLGGALAGPLGVVGGPAVGVTVGALSSMLLPRAMRQATITAVKHALGKVLNDPQLEAWWKAAQEQRVSQANIYGNEIEHLIQVAPELKRFLSRWQRVLQSTWNPANLLDIISQARETIPRLASFYDDMARIERGETVKALSVDLRELSPIEAAGKIARVAPVDYGAVTEKYNRHVRGFLFPFATWYHKTFSNTHRRFRKAPFRMFARRLIPLIAMVLWNTLFQKEQEERMPMWLRLLPHLNTGYVDKEGRDIVISFQYPVAMAARMVGLDIMPWLVAEVADGKKTLGQASRELLGQIVKSPTAEHVRLLNPLLRSLVAYFSGREPSIPPAEGRRIVPKAFENSDEGRKMEALWHLEQYLAPYAQFMRAERSRNLEGIDNPIIRSFLLGFADISRAGGVRYYDPAQAQRSELARKREELTAEYADAIEQGDVETTRRLNDEFLRLGSGVSRRNLLETLRGRQLYRMRESQREMQRSP